MRLIKNCSASLSWLTGYQISSNFFSMLMLLAFSEFDSANACGGILDSRNGEIVSPSYPAHYPSNTACRWEIYLDKEPQSRITLNFTDFKLEGCHRNDNFPRDCRCDKVFVHSGLSNGDWLNHGTFCGTTLPPPITSAENRLLVEFESDHADSFKGFAATYFSAPSDSINTCGRLLEEPNGRITSPSYPGQYPFGVRCTYEIKVEPQNRIFLNFTHFELEGCRRNSTEPSDCRCDKVSVHSRLSNGDWHDHGIFCGIVLPPAITSVGNHLLIEFVSDHSNSYTGFAAMYSSVGPSTSTRAPNTHVPSSRVSSTPAPSTTATPDVFSL